MALVERTAAYLEGPAVRRQRPSGRGHCPLRQREHASDDAAARPRVLVPRPARSEGGRHHEAEAKKKRQGITLQSPGPPLARQAGFDELPEACAVSIEESFALQDRIMQLDQAMTDAPVDHAVQAGRANPVEEQMVRLAAGVRGLSLQAELELKKARDDRAFRVSGDASRWRLRI